MFSKILIANRGEIACRIIRTARRMGIATVAVCSEADRDALHVEMADEAVVIGPAPARQSYLDGRKVIDAALATRAEAIHPGYGFLSENAAFAEACVAAGLVFIGPPPAAIQAMGGKSAAKALMSEAGVPVVPGYHGEDQSPERLAAEAEKAGYPVLIKASAGGGGKGMRIVEQPAAFAAALAGAQREALGSFGDAHMLIEKYLLRPRHIEVQVFADNHGNCLSLFERDCSIQRRHQKVVEEAPAPDLSQPLRERMYAAAVSAARTIGYSGAGTVEFLLDQRGEFYFMEMNTRLQVEHPVTEFITGLDLVEWQLRVAAGEAVPESWQNLQINGHAIEVRLYAEDPANDFLPSMGRISYLAMPPETAHLRIDSGIRAGDTIGVHYDPMIAKLIVWDESRDAAVRRLQTALRQVAIAGVTANTGFLARLSGLDDFVSAKLDTGFIARNETALQPPQPADDVVALAAAALVAARKPRIENNDPHSPWAVTNGFRLNLPAREVLRFSISQQAMEIPVTCTAQGFHIRTGGKEMAAEKVGLVDSRLSIMLDGRKRSAIFHTDEAGSSLFIEGDHYRLSVPDDMMRGDMEAVAGGLTAPMPGVIRAVLVSAGERVASGQALVVMEAMKMEHTIRAPSDGVVNAISHAEGAMVEAGAALADFTPDA